MYTVFYQFQFSLCFRHGLDPMEVGIAKSSEIGTQAPIRARKEKRVMSSSKATSEPCKILAMRTPRATPHTGNQETPTAPPLKALKKRG
ncbi:hypothetical protein N7472_000582 [Penicillium cf. griseofulvum]|uniref:Uncharacterized protein n=1 Tax=Penicillium cf. griseofulvum TaxID=2972120 RepID=A0A9W9N0F6_9EURO|nr:hypothetical protein N7472_000582 [Penicillium cf. griseofulvum]KAJ5427995.1 hypothetical protein N7445_009449 [Penicillium cf. griseofulvum]